jgi:hypothetical protein
VVQIISPDHVLEEVFLSPTIEELAADEDRGPIPDGRDDVGGAGRVALDDDFPNSASYGRRAYVQRPGALRGVRSGLLIVNKGA